MIPETDPTTTAPETTEEAAPLTLESMRQTLGFSKPKEAPVVASEDVEAPAEGEEALDPIEEAEEALEEAEGVPEHLAPVLDGMKGLVGLVQSLQAEVAAMKGGAPVQGETPALPTAPAEGEPLVFVTDETYDDVVGNPASLNTAFNAVYQTARTDALAQFRAELPRLLQEEKRKEESVKSESAAASNEFWNAHTGDLQYIQGDERRGRRFMQEVQRVQAAHPDLVAKRDYHALYGKALESFNLLRADFEAASTPKPAPGGSAAPKPATVTTPSARGGLRGHVAQADDAVTAMRKTLGLPTTQKGPNR